VCGGSFCRPTRTRCSLRRVGRVNLDERHPGLSGLIGQKEPELSERPRMQHGPLGLAKPYPVAYPRQLFDGDTASGASASATMPFEILWFMSVAKRVSLRRRFLSNRRAEVVFLACNRFRNRNCRLR
jgi:hypothetical protein